MFLISFFEKLFFFADYGATSLNLNFIARVASVASRIVMLCHFVTLCTTNTARIIFSIVAGTKRNTDVVTSAKLLVLMQGATMRVGAG